MVYITGDCHGWYEKFEESEFPEQKDLTKDDYVIVLGDFGIWHDTEEEREQLQKLQDKNFTILFLDGNHENFDRLNSDEFPVIDLLGGKAHEIRPGIYHLMRGQVFDIEDQKYFVFGGASSHDVCDGIVDPADYPDMETAKEAYMEKSCSGKMCRLKHETWWEEELPNQEEMDRGLKSLQDNNFKVDYVLTHCLPTSIMPKCEKPDVLTNYFDDLLDQGLDFKKWYCGHYHMDNTVNEKYHVAYDEIFPVGEEKIDYGYTFDEVF